MTTGTQRLIDDLTADLSPVRPIPPLRALALGVAALWAALFVLAAYERGLRPDLLQGVLEIAPFAGIVAGLLLAAVGGVAGALAASVPGRESLGSAGRWLGLGGLALALAVGSYAAMTLRSVSPVPAGSDLRCFAMAFGLGLLPGAMLAGVLLSGWVANSGRGALLALFGGFASGALAVHLLCPISAGRHLLFAHIGPVLILPLLGVLPLAALLRRFAR